MKKVFVYTRISTAEQLDGGGIDRQREECLRFCATQQWEVMRVFEEQKTGSAAAFDRPVLSELISLCGDAYDVRTIVVERADRIARDLIVSELFFQECKARGIQVYVADCGEEMVNADGDPTRKLIRQILAALSEWNKNEIAKKLLAGRQRTAELTGWPCGGKPAYGRAGEHEMIWVRRMLYFHRQGQKLLKLCRTVNYHPKWRDSRPKLWKPSTVAGIIETWNHRIGEIKFDSLLE